MEGDGDAGGRRQGEGEGEAGVAGLAHVESRDGCAAAPERGVHVADSPGLSGEDDGSTCGAGAADTRCQCPDAGYGEEDEGCVCQWE